MGQFCFRFFFFFILLFFLAWLILDFLSFFVNALWAGIFQPKHDVVAATSPQFFAAVAGKFVGVIRKTPFVMEVGDLWPVSFVGVGLMKQGFWLRFFQVFCLYRGAGKNTALEVQAL